MKWDESSRILSDKQNDYSFRRLCANEMGMIDMSVGTDNFNGD